MLLIAPLKVTPPLVTLLIAQLFPDANMIGVAPVPTKFTEVPATVVCVLLLNWIGLFTVSPPAFNASTPPLATVTVPLADLVAGYQIPVITLPKDVKRYVRLNYTVTGTAPTTGKVTAGIVAGVQTNG